MNGEETSFFKLGKKYDQGDAISPLLYNLVGDVLTKMVMKRARKGLNKGVDDGLREQVSSLSNIHMTPLFSLTYRT